MKYEILEHKADIKIKVFGKTLEELFENAALAMVSILKHDANLRMDANAANVEKIKIQSSDQETLLADFLNEILAKSQINKKVYKVKSIKFKVLNKRVELEAEIVGFPIENFDEDIKAATYHDLKISEKGGSFEAIVLFDI